ncbi:hypothetical protein BD560DRAFT_428264 [Blakeslea trispora]|nr:hypothetical protein BD560DRAFT_428264 [Blakeslea trispora]
MVRNPPSTIPLMNPSKSLLGLSDCVRFNVLLLKLIQLTNKSLNCILRDQFPSGIGLRERKVGRQRFVEINFPSAEERNQALSNPFVIEDQPLQVSRTLNSNANVVRIGIAEIPHEREAILKPKLIDLLSQYGDILEIGLRYIEDGH